MKPKFLQFKRVDTTLWIYEKSIIGVKMTVDRTSGTPVYNLMLSNGILFEINHTEALEFLKNHVKIIR